MKMPRLAFSGHRGLNAATASLVDRAIRDALAANAADLTGLSCLADGADHIFARAIADLGGRLEVVIPAERYRDGLPEAARPGFDELVALATGVHRMPFREPSEWSYMAAGKFLIDHADRLYAVWDGKPARGYGGTADVVGYARERGIPVHVIWPDGAERDPADDA
jgi:hypothetical protein